MHVRASNEPVIVSSPLELAPEYPRELACA
jgi:hypothetical protein